MVSKPDDSGEPRTAVGVLPSNLSALVPVPVARARFRVGGVGMPFEDLKCKQVYTTAVGEKDQVVSMRMNW
jgi:hypothetical protein